MNQIPVLDKGFVQLVEVMGNDLSIIDAARVSYDKKADQFSEERNRGLLKYLIQHGHTSPLEMVEFKFRVKAPAVVWWQWVRHRMAEYNAQSGRYTPYKEDEFYLPNKLRGQDPNNKQGSIELDDPQFKELLEQLANHYEAGYKLYQEMLNKNVAKELARLALPGWACYHEFIVKMNLHSLLNFCKKRSSEAAQWEIRQYSLVIEKFIKEICPWTYEFAKEFKMI